MADLKMYVAAVRSACENRMKGYETPIHAADVIRVLDLYAAQVAVMAEALEPFSKAAELFVDYQSEYPAFIYRPAAGDEYDLDSDHLLAARKARLAAAKEPS